MTRFIVILLVAWAAVLVLARSDEIPTVSVADRVFHAEVADTTATQARGLSGRERLADDEAMLFVFLDAVERTFWMKDMRFAIDIVWIKDGAVVGVARNARPEPGIADAELTRYRSPGPVDAVLEVAAGIADVLPISEGDVVIH